MGPEPACTTEDETLKPTRVWYLHARDRSGASDDPPHHRRSVACGPSSAAEQKATPPRCRTLISRREEYGTHDGPDPPRTDGGTDAASPYVIPTGPGYLTTRCLGKGGVSIPVQETALSWAAGDTVTVRHPDAQRLVLTRDADECPTVALLSVRTRQDRARRVYLPLSVLKHLGLNPGDDARVYTDPDQDRLVVVDATDDPRIHTPIKEVIAVATDDHVDHVDDEADDAAPKYRVTCSDDCSFSGAYASLTAVCAAVIEHSRTTSHIAYGSVPAPSHDVNDDISSWSVLPVAEFTNAVENGTKPDSNGDEPALPSLPVQPSSTVPECGDADTTSDAAAEADETADGADKTLCTAVMTHVASMTLRESGDKPCRWLRGGPTQAEFRDAGGTCTCQGVVLTPGASEECGSERHVPWRLSGAYRPVVRADGGVNDDDERGAEGATTADWHDLTALDRDLLCIIAGHDDTVLTGAQVYRRLETQRDDAASKAWVYRRINHLAEHGLIDKGRSTLDARTTELRLTKAGQALIAAHRDRLQRITPDAIDDASSGGASE